jgi:hypothetical protein
MQIRVMGAGGGRRFPRQVMASMAGDLSVRAPRPIDCLSGIVAALTGRRGVATNRHALADPLAPFADHAPFCAAARGGHCWSTAA